MNFRSFEDLNRTIANNLKKVPTDTDLIVGIPRSGLLAANILAMHLHLPLTDLSNFIEGKIIITTEDWMKMYETNLADIKSIFVIDDSVRSGQSIENARESLKKLYPDKKLVFATVYMHPKSIEKADVYFELCPVSRIFEWNMMNHFRMSGFCAEIDGVLCSIPKYEENDDGENYLHFIENANPTRRVRRKIGYLVTNRLEKYRVPTEKWLNKHGIEYGELVMRNFSNQLNCNAINNYSLFKGDFYKKLEYSALFIESSYREACAIAEISGKMVYCVEKRDMIYPSWFASRKRFAVDLLKKGSNKLKNRIKRFNGIPENK